MPQFFPLTVTNVRKTTRDAVVVTLKPEEPERFAFTEGQYLTFRRHFDGQEIRRSYSICAERQSGLLQVGIKQVDGGAFSTWANTALDIGDTLEAMPPMGQFVAQTDDRAEYLLAFAAGSGITPILSIIASTLRDNTQARVTLVYVNRSPASIMFREELEDLKNTYMGRLNVAHVLSGETGEDDIFRGRLTAEKCRRLFETWVDISSVTTTYICGPEPMRDMLRDSLAMQGVPKERIRFELFAANQAGRAPLRAVAVNADTVGMVGSVTLGGETRNVRLNADTSLLDAAIDSNLDAPYACKAGVCSTCKARITSGAVEMVANHALEDDEVNSGFVLTCQSYAVGKEPVAWDYDQAGH